jgi:thioredoxin-dependent peroxiredoxin
MKIGKSLLALSFASTISFAACGGGAENMEEGMDAPDFTLEDHNGTAYTLSDYEDKSPVVLYFYPKANTPGCTTQACGIRDKREEYEQSGVAVFGVSVDDKEAIAEFVKEHNLNFPLLSDADKKVSEKYDVLNSVGMSSRVTFVIDKDGKIHKIIRDVNVGTHADDALEIAKGLV